MRSLTMIVASDRFQKVSNVPIQQVVFIETPQIGPKKVTSTFLGPLQYPLLPSNQ